MQAEIQHVRLLTISSRLVTTVAGSFNSGNADGYGSDVAFNYNTGIVADPSLTVAYLVSSLP
jgi:hypothetical protein